MNVSVSITSTGSVTRRPDPLVYVKTVCVVFGFTPLIVLAIAGSKCDFDIHQKWHCVRSSLEIPYHGCNLAWVYCFRHTERRYEHHVDDVDDIDAFTYHDQGSNLGNQQVAKVIETPYNECSVKTLVD
jgi:hypothetical protein